jgi:hypothetical protein
MAERKLILSIDQDVCGYVSFFDEFPQNINLASDLTNNPTVIQVPVETDVIRGWKYSQELGFYDPDEQ